MADDALTSDDESTERASFEGVRIEFPDGEFGEIRIRRRESERVDGEAGSEPGEPEDRTRELRVSRHDSAAARCGRWGDEQWR